MGKNKNNDELLRSQINDIIEGEIQNGINDYLEEKEKKTLRERQTSSCSKPAGLNPICLNLNWKSSSSVISGPIGWNLE